MPSSPGYVRNYTEEAKTAKARGEQGTGPTSGSAQRHKARRLALKLGMIKPGSKSDINHIKPIVKGGKTTASNINVESEHKNRSYPRTKSAGMK